MPYYIYMKSIIRTSFLSALALAPTLASAATTIVGGGGSGGGFFGISWGNGGGSGAAGCSATICGIANTILYLINSILVPVLFAVSFLMFLYGVAQKFIFSSDKASSDGRNLVLWGVVGFAIMISLWGLVNIVGNTFGLNGSYAPTLPTSFSS